MELEGEKDDVILIAHESVLRCIYAYLMDIEESKVPFIEIPLESLVELEPIAYGCMETWHRLD